MAEVIEILPADECVYVCKCGCPDFWVVPPYGDLTSFAGFVCQECEDFYTFPENYKREHVMVFRKED